ncbi:MAG: NAD(P)H-dependent oxidoreductase [Nibricoccus sp.]
MVKSLPNELGTTERLGEGRLQASPGSPSCGAMKFFVLSGSHRVEAQSLKVAKYTVAALPQEVAGAEVFLYSLSGNPLPLWDETTGGAPDELWDPISRELKAADALVVVTPEWNGMVTPGVKNFLMNCSADEIGHKPGLIVTVSAGRGGSYPVSELRMSGTKNNRLAWIPEHVIVQHVEGNLNAPDDADGIAKEDATIRARLRYALRVLGAYGTALRSVRASGVVDHKTFRSGM